MDTRRPLVPDAARCETIVLLASEKSVVEAPMDNLDAPKSLSDDVGLLIESRDFGWESTDDEAGFLAVLVATWLS